MYKFFAIIFSVIIYSCAIDKNEYQVPDNFVTIKNKSFNVNGENYFPIMLNYVVEFRNLNDSIVISPAKYYEDITKYEADNIPENDLQLDAHLQLITEMGFNSIRLIVLDRLLKDTNAFYYQSDSKILLNENKSKLIAALKSYIKRAERYNIKVMLLLENSIDKTEVERFNKDILKEFNNCSTIFAFDFFNEPLYFDNEDKEGDKKHRTKESAFKIVKQWHNLMKEYAPNHLFTIGFSEPIEVFEWDPALLPVDFIAFHTYHPLRVPNEIYWYAKYTNKPWMIGETALPSENDSVPYEYQQAFLRETYKRVINCGGSGFGWWEFQELPNSHFEASYTGLLNHEGITHTKEGNFSIIGTVKPAVKELHDLKNYTKGECDCKTNYANMLGYENFVITGKIINKDTGQPIEGAVVRACNKWWSVCQNTFSDKDGNFALYSNDKCERFYFSAPKMSFIEAFVDTLTYLPINNYKGSMLDLNNVKLEYHKIGYLNFLMKDSLNNKSDLKNGFIFNFKPEFFNNAKYKTNIGVIELEALEME